MATSTHSNLPDPDDVNPDEVTAVLLPDGWHPIEPCSLMCDPWRFAWHRESGGHLQIGDDPFGAVSFADMRTGAWVRAPWSSVLAVQLRAWRDDDAR